MSRDLLCLFLVSQALSDNLISARATEVLERHECEAAGDRSVVVILQLYVQFFICQVDPGSLVFQYVSSRSTILKSQWHYRQVLVSSHTAFTETVKCQAEKGTLYSDLLPPLPKGKIRKSKDEHVRDNFSAMAFPAIKEVLPKVGMCILELSGVSGDDFI